MVLRVSITGIQMWRQWLFHFSGLCPGCPAFYGNRAACHMMLGQFVQALEDARTSVQLDPNFVKGYVRVAKCCVALGELQGARQVCHSRSREQSEARQPKSLPILVPKCSWFLVIRACVYFYELRDSDSEVYKRLLVSSSSLEQSHVLTNKDAFRGMTTYVIEVTDFKYDL